MPPDKTFVSGDTPPGPGRKRHIANDAKDARITRIANLTRRAMELPRRHV
jgi:hypothetical protein